MGEDLRQLVAAYPELSPAELARALTSGPGPGEAEAWEQRLVQHHLGMVLTAAESRTKDTPTAEDLFQEGSAALVILVHGLDPSRPLSPEDFHASLQAALGQVMDALLAERVRAQREDQRWADDAERLAAEEAQLRLETGAEPSDASLAKALGWSVERVVPLRRAIDRARSTDDEQLMDILQELEEQ
ncbi:MAG: sigma factor [Candidatus Dormibacteria bacterium]